MSYSIHFVPVANAINDKLICNVELHFSEGFKLVGFSLWRSTYGDGKMYVTCPSRKTTNGFFEYVKDAVDGSTARLKKAILAAYQDTVNPSVEMEEVFEAVPPEIAPGQTFSVVPTVEMDKLIQKDKNIYEVGKISPTPLPSPRTLPPAPPSTKRRVVID